MMEFGKMYKVTARLKKVHSEVTQSSRWQRLSHEPIPMMYIGYRDIHDGKWVTVLSGGPDWPDETETYFQSSKRIRAYLMVENERKNPVYIHPDDVLELVEVE